MTDDWLMAKARFGKQEASLPADENPIVGSKMIQVTQKQKGN